MAMELPGNPLSWQGWCASASRATWHVVCACPKHLCQGSTKPHHFGAPGNTESLLGAVRERGCLRIAWGLLSKKSQAAQLASSISLLFSLLSVSSNLETIAMPFRTGGVKRKLPFQPECCRTTLFSCVFSGVGIYIGLSTLSLKRRLLYASFAFELRRELYISRYILI